MPPLKNPRREKFCREVIKGEKYSNAYKKSYPYAGEKSAEKSGSRLMTYEEVKHRCLEIMEAESGLRIEDFLSDLKDLKRAEYPMVINHKLQMFSDNPVRLEAVKTGLKILGVLHPNTNINIDNRELTINLQPQDIEQAGTIANALRDIRLRQDIDGEIV